MTTYSNTFLLNVNDTKYVISDMQKGIPSRDMAFLADEIYVISKTGTASPIKIRKGSPKQLTRKEVMMWILSATQSP